MCAVMFQSKVRTNDVLESFCNLGYGLWKTKVEDERLPQEQRLELYFNATETCFVDVNV